MTHSRSQTTYEELKHNDFSFTDAVFKLPDYLWGIETGLPKALSMQCRALPDYLWGIETILCEYGDDKIAGLPDYLWGIETISQQILVFYH